MGTRRLRTADYSEEARERLGRAVARQREADGYKFRPAFAKAAKISLRSLAAVETGEPGVGAANLRAIGRALSTWTEDTPREILDGGPIPPTHVETVEPRDEFERKVMASHVDLDTKIHFIRRHRAALAEEARMLREIEQHRPSGAAAHNDLTESESTT